MEFIKMQSYFIENITKDLTNRKKEVFFERLLELNIDLDIEEQENKRFKDICVTHDGNEETYWYNDGSNEGLRIITFVNLDIFPSYSFEERSFSITSEIKYY